MDQGIYPNLDRPAFNQPYGQAYYAPPVENYNYPPNPAVVHNNYNHSNQANLKEPLIEKKSHKATHQLKRTIAGLVALVCLAIELMILYYIKEHTYLYEYCYWKFNIKNYRSNVDQSLIVADGKGGARSFYDDLQCYNETKPYPECPGLCSFADSLTDIKRKYINYGMIAAEATIGILALLYISSWITKKPKIKKPLVSVLAILSFVIFLSTWAYYTSKLGLSDIHEVDDEKYKDVEGFDEPSDFELADGGKSLIWLMVFMMIYRVALIFLAK